MAHPVSQFACLAGLWLFSAFSASAQILAAPVAPTILIDGPEEVVFDPKRDACDGHDVPDVPPRLYRDASGDIKIFALHFENRAMVTRDFKTFKVDCKIVLRGTGNADPAAYDDRSWISATWTRDGKAIHGLAHHEYQGNTHKGRCSKPDYLSCWFNTILAIQSGDGGTSFSKAPAPVVASAPFTQDAQQGRHRGFFNPSNIITDGVWHYMITSTTGWNGQPPGA